VVPRRCNPLENMFENYQGKASPCLGGIRVLNEIIPGSLRGPKVG
jgi:hypothetical protein